MLFLNFDFLIRFLSSDFQIQAETEPIYKVNCKLMGGFNSYWNKLSFKASLDLPSHLNIPRCRYTPLGKTYFPYLDLDQNILTEFLDPWMKYLFTTF